MPTYDYECGACGNTFEAFQKITDSPLEKCPKCNRRLKRLVGSGSAIIFKGPGFYATDYRKKAGTPKEGNNTCPEAKKGCTGCSNQP